MHSVLVAWLSRFPPFSVFPFTFTSHMLASILPRSAERTKFLLCLCSLFVLKLGGVKRFETNLPPPAVQFLLLEAKNLLFCQSI